MTEAKHPIRNSIVASLVTAAITGIVIQIIPGGWPWVFGEVKQVWTSTTTWLASPTALPTWLVLTLSVFSLCLLVAVVARATVSTSRDVFQPFTEAEFFGVKWRWRYGASGVHNLATFCPVCDLQIHAQDGSEFGAIEATIFRCDDGHWKSERFDCSYEELEDRVRRKIQQKLRKDLEDAKAKET